MWGLAHSYKDFRETGAISTRRGPRRLYMWSNVVCDGTIVTRYSKESPPALAKGFSTRNTRLWLPLIGFMV